MNNSDQYTKKRMELANQITYGAPNNGHNLVTDNEKLGYTAPGSLINEKKFEIGAKASLGEISEEMRILTG